MKKLCVHQCPFVHMQYVTSLPSCHFASCLNPSCVCCFCNPSFLYRLQDRNEKVTKSWTPTNHNVLCFMAEWSGKRCQGPTPTTHVYRQAVMSESEPETTECHWVITVGTAFLVLHLVERGQVCKKELENCYQTRWDSICISCPLLILSFAHIITVSWRLNRMMCNWRKRNREVNSESNVSNFITPLLQYLLLSVISFYLKYNKDLKWPVFDGAKPSQTLCSQWFQIKNEYGSFWRTI